MQPQKLWIWVFVLCVKGFLEQVKIKALQRVIVASSMPSYINEYLQKQVTVPVSVHCDGVEYHNLCLCYHSMHRHIFHQK